MNALARFARKYSYAAASTAYLFTAGVRSSRHRGLIAHIARHFGFVEEVEMVPRVSFNELIGDTPAVRLLEPDGVDGNVSLLELMTLVAMVRSMDPRRIFEIGTFDGRTTLNLAANSHPEARVFTLDLPRSDLDATSLRVSSGDRAFIAKDESGARFHGRPESARIEQLFGDSARFDFSPYTGSVDFVFIDGSHAYEYVLKDTETALRLMSPRGGVVFWHDYGIWPGVTRALNELFSSGEEPFRALRRVEGTSLVCLQTR